MLIKDIKFRRIRKLAKKRLKQQKARWGGEDKGLVDDFVWNDTPEGYLFWSDINVGNYEEEFKLRPDLFRPTKRELEEAYIFDSDLNKDIEARASADAFMRRQPA